MFLIYQLKNQ